MLLHYMRKGAKTGLIRYTLFGLLLLAAGGMVFMDVGGFFRRGVQRGDVARVGHQGISLSSFDRMLQTVLRQQGLNLSDAWRFGVLQQVLTMEIRESLIAHAAADMGLRVSDAGVAARIAEFVTPMQTDGGTPQEALDRLLRMQGMTEAQFVSIIRRDMTADLIRASLQSDFVPLPDGAVRDLYAYDKEERSLTVLFLPDADPGKVIPSPTDADLQGVYKASEGIYKIPERRTLTVSWFGIDAVRKGIEISDEDLKKAYDGALSDFQLPEMRTLAQAILREKTQADAVAAKAKAGMGLEEAVLAVTGKKEDWHAPQDFSRDGLFPAIADPVFSAKEKEIIGPVQTPLGWHVLVLESIKPPRTKTFEEAREDLRKEETDARAAEKMSTLSDEVDDRIAGGAALEDVAKTLSMELKTEVMLDSQGLTEDGKAGLVGFESDRANILENAFALMEGEISPVFELSDGRHAVVRTDRIVPESVKSFDSVKPDLLKRWEQQQKKLANMERAKSIWESVKTGKETIEQAAARTGIKATIVSKVQRGETPPDFMTSAAVASAFSATRGETILSDGVEGQILAKVLDIRPGDASKAPAEELKTLGTSLRREGSDADLVSYLGYLQNFYGVVVNEALLNQTYGAGREGQ